MRTQNDPPLDTSGLTDEERADLSVGTKALAIKVGARRARAWARERIDSILRGRAG